MTVFALMDQWITAAGRSDAWLDFGLELLDDWHGRTAADSALDGQPHLLAVLSELNRLRPVVPAAPDPVALAVWFHHSPPDAAFHALSLLGEPDLAGEVARLVRLLGSAAPPTGDPTGLLLSLAHRSATPERRVALVLRLPGDQ